MSKKTVGLVKSNYKNPAIKWIDERLPIFTLMDKEYGQFPTPKNFNYLWNFGPILVVVLLVMILTGVFLAMFYTANTQYAFESVERIMRDVNYGWLIRYIHMNGASMFFVAVYLHMARGLYYGSYKKPRELMWITGVIILLLMMATAFMGYVLPWGQMSFWGATVITNLFSSIPIFGETIVTWMWGGFSIDNATLNRFFSLHFLLPFIIFAAVFIHIVALHITGSNNPTGIEIQDERDSIPFHPYYTTKDFFGILVFLIFFAVFVFYAPDYLGHPDNYTPANPLVTPAHIVPEWYFLPFYAILRAVTSEVSFFGITLIEAKLGGVLLMFGSIFVLFILPWLDTSSVRSTNYRPIYKIFFWILMIDLLTLGYVGGKPAEQPYVLIGQFATAYYFCHFLVILPLLGKFEKPLKMPKSIHDAVKKKFK